MQTTLFVLLLLFRNKEQVLFGFSKVSDQGAGKNAGSDK